MEGPGRQPGPFRRRDLAAAIRPPSAPPLEAAPTRAIPPLVQFRPAQASGDRAVPLQPHPARTSRPELSPLTASESPPRTMLFLGELWEARSPGPQGKKNYGWWTWGKMRCFRWESLPRPPDSVARAFGREGDEVFERGPGETFFKKVSHRPPEAPMTVIRQFGPADMPGW
jgi:hypothetical protein